MGQTISNDLHSSEKIINNYQQNSIIQYQFKPSSEFDTKIYPVIQFLNNYHQYENIKYFGASIGINESILNIIYSRLYNISKSGQHKYVYEYFLTYYEKDLYPLIATNQNILLHTTMGFEEKEVVAWQKDLNNTVCTFSDIINHLCSYVARFIINDISVIETKYPENIWVKFNYANENTIREFGKVWLCKCSSIQYNPFEHGWNKPNLYTILPSKEEHEFKEYSIIYVVDFFRNLLLYISKKQYMNRYEYMSPVIRSSLTVDESIKKAQYDYNHKPRKLLDDNYFMVIRYLIPKKSNDNNTIIEITENTLITCNFLSEYTQYIAGIALYNILK